MNVVRINADVADNFWKRFTGLMFKSYVSRPLLFTNANSIHTLFMRMPIDVVWLNSSNEVVGLGTLRPWRMSMPRRGATSVLECETGSISLAVGDRVEIVT